jgi:signal transduction histidine kinase
VAAIEVGRDRHRIVVPANGPLLAPVDAIRLEQVVTNLVDNAVKYSPRGDPIEIFVGSSHPEEVTISVRDHGLGIAPEHRAHIFDRFFQAHPGSHYTGLGLGLFISRQIVELHGGTLEAEFPADGGSRFVVRLPGENAKTSSGDEYPERT